MNALKTEGPQEGIFYRKCKAFLKNLGVTYRLNTTKLIIFNYVLMMFIASQDIFWDYPFKDVETAYRYGLELVPPEIESSFGFAFRLITIIINALAMGAVLHPKQKFRLLLVPVMLWSIFTIFAILQNTLGTVWVLYQLEVPFSMYSAVFAVAMFAILLESKLLLNVFCYYDYLCYAV